MRPSSAPPPISGGSEATAPGAGSPAPESPRRYFNFLRVQADDAETMQAIRRLRYDVYCLECKYLDPSKYTDGLASAEYDPYSTHFCAKNERGELVATLRLVFDS